MSTTETWDYADDYMSQTLTRETPHGVFRAVIETDTYGYGDAPENEFGCPVFRMSRGYYGYGAPEATGYGSESDKASGVDIESAYAHFEERSRGLYETVDALSRWLRIFHGGSVKVIASTVHQGGDSFLTYDTRAMRERWGQTGDMLETSDPEADEWQAYIDGEVYGIRVERATFGPHELTTGHFTGAATCANCNDADLDMSETCDEATEWHEIEGTDCWGYYGEEWAKQAAIGALDFEVKHTAEGMLPLAGDAS